MVFQQTRPDQHLDNYVTLVSPLAFYSHTRRVTFPVFEPGRSKQHHRVSARCGGDPQHRSHCGHFSGLEYQNRMAAQALAGDIEFDLFRGKADFSNAGGVFPAMPLLPI